MVSLEKPKRSTMRAKRSSWFQESLMIMLLIFSNNLANSKAFNMSIQNQGWHLLTSDWPTLNDESNAISLNKAEVFYFQDDFVGYQPRFSENNVPVLINLNFTESFIKQMDKIDRTIITISFKIWFFAQKVPENDSNFTSINMHYMSYHENQIGFQPPPMDLSKIYSPYSGQWAPIKFRIDSHKLSNFKLEYYSGYYFVAFQNFNVINESGSMVMDRFNPIYQKDQMNITFNRTCLSFTHSNGDVLIDIRLSYLIQPIYNESFYIENFENRVLFTQFFLDPRSDSCKRICLQDYLRFSTENFSLIVESNLDREKSNLTLQLLKDENVVDNPIYFLRSFSRDFDWKNDWLIWDDEEFQNNFDFDLDNIRFIYDCNQGTSSDQPINFRLSSKWIYYDDEIFKGKTFKYVTKINHPSLIIYPRICDQIGLCTEVITGLISSNQDQQQWFDFTIDQKPTTSLFRLEFVFELNRFFCQSNQTIYLEAIFKMIYFGDPCTTFGTNPCLRGYCSSTVHHKAAKCSCPAGFIGNRCESKDFCSTEPNPCGQLKCSNTVHSFRCLCNQTDFIIWNGTQCSKPILDFEKNFTKLPITLPLDRSDEKLPLFSVNFNTENLNLENDLCIKVQYEYWSDGHIQTHWRILLDIGMEIIDNVPTLWDSQSLLLQRSDLFGHPKQNSMNETLTIEFCLVENFFKTIHNWNRLLTVITDLRIHYTIQTNIEAESADNLTISFKDISFEIVPLKREYENLAPGTRGNLNWSINNTNGLLIIETNDWLEYKPKLDLFQFQANSSLPPEQQMIEAKFTYFTNDSVFLNQIDMKINGSKDDYWQIFLNLGQLPQAIVSFRIAIYIQCNVDNVKFINDWNCNRDECIEQHGYCYSDYELGRAVCQCSLGYFGSKCENKDPCIESQSYCSAIVDDYWHPDLCLPIDSANFNCSCSWPDAFRWDSQQKSCQPKFVHHKNVLPFDTESSKSAYLSNVISPAQTNDQSGHSFQSIRNAAQEYSNLLNHVHHLNNNSSPYNIYFTLFPKNSFLSLIFTNLLAKESVCLGIEYHLRSTQDLIGLKMSSDDDYLWINQPNELGQTNHGKIEFICSNDWIANMNESDSIAMNFTAQYGDDSHNVIGFHIIENPHLINNSRTKHVDHIPSLKFVPLDNAAQVSTRFWPLRLPSFVWKTLANGSIQYDSEISLNENQTRISYLLSDWILYDKNYSNFTHQFHFQHYNHGVTNRTLQPIVFDDHLKDITDQIQINISGQMIKFHLGEDYEAKLYRVGIRITDGSHTNISDPLIIDDLNVDDYCVDNGCQNQSNCTVDFSRAAIKRYKCECPEIFEGDYCENISCHKLCPKDETYKKDDCRLTNSQIKNRTQLSIYCQCTTGSNIVDEIFEQSFEVDDGMRIVRINRCRKVPITWWQIIISVSASLMALIMTVFLVLCMRQSCGLNSKKFIINHKLRKETVQSQFKYRSEYGGKASMSASIVDSDNLELVGRDEVLMKQVR